MVLDIVSRDPNDLGNQGFYWQLEHSIANSRESKRIVRYSIVQAMDNAGIPPNIRNKMRNRLLALFLKYGNDICRYNEVTQFYQNADKSLLYEIARMYRPASGFKRRIIETILAHHYFSNIPAARQDMIRDYIINGRTEQKFMNAFMSLYLCQVECEADVIKVIRLFLFDDAHQFDAVINVAAKKNNLYIEERNFINNANNGLAD